jgi:hypothetical protein
VSALRRLLPLLLLFALGTARGETIEVQGVQMQAANDAYVVHADFYLDLPPRLEEALSNGVPLHFVVEFELVRPRWYWFDEKTALEKLELRLSYLPLSQQYRISGVAEQLSYISLGEALRAMGRIRGWEVLERNRLVPGRIYVGWLRMRLDTAQLPKPYQMIAVTDREWTVASEWRRFSFMPAAAEAR